MLVYGLAGSMKKEDMHPLAILFAAAVALSACSPPPPNSAAVPAAAASAARPSDASDPHSPSIRNDPDSISIDVVTKPATRKSAGLDEVYLLLSKTHRKGDATLVYVQWTAVYAAHASRSYNRASGDNVRSYDFQELDRKVGHCGSSGCVYGETYNITIPPADLKRGASEGIRLKIYARNGDEVVVQLPASLIAEFNAKLAEVQKMRTKS